MSGELRMRFPVILMGTCCLILAASGVSYGVPYLQLDISDGTYDPLTETIFSTTNPATLYALVDSTSSEFNSSDTFYISAAVSPKLEDFALDLGYFEFAGERIDVTAEMVYGTAPIEELKKELPTHDIFPTWFTERSFDLEFAGKAAEYNSQDSPGGLVASTSGTLYYEDFAVDITGLADGYAIHFDLYTKNDDGTIAKFAPFSHDVQMVPVPGAMLLGSLGLSVSGWLLRRKRELA